jgi:hypothetical protein
MSVDSYELLLSEHQLVIRCDNENMAKAERMARLLSMELGTHHTRVEGEEQALAAKSDKRQDDTKPLPTDSTEALLDKAKRIAGDLIVALFYLSRNTPDRVPANAFKRMLNIRQELDLGATLLKRAESVIEEVEETA